nr:metal tolerance protein 4-like isoform X2 [Ipomoea batatas]
MDLNATLKSFDPRSCIDSLESPSDEVNEDEDKKEHANNERAMNISNWTNIFLLAFKFPDHTNVVGLVAAVLGDRFYWWLDPAGAIALAFYTTINWSGTVLENAVSLVGQSAPPEVLQKLTYMVLRRSLRIKRVDTVRANVYGLEAQSSNKTS